MHQMGAEKSKRGIFVDPCTYKQYMETTATIAACQKRLEK